MREWTDVDKAPALDSLTYRRSESGKPGSSLVLQQITGCEITSGLALSENAACRFY